MVSEPPGGIENAVRETTKLDREFVTLETVSRADPEFVNRTVSNFVLFICTVPKFSDVGLEDIAAEVIAKKFELVSSGAESEASLILIRICDEVMKGHVHA
jgi:hypothetical protein